MQNIVEAEVFYKNLTNLKQDIAELFITLKPDLEEPLLIKPNLVYGRPPGKSVSTNAYMLEALVSFLKDVGFKDITIAEGSALLDTKQEFIKANYDILNKYNIKFVDLNKDTYKLVKIKKPLELEKIEIAKTFLEAKSIINFPVAKCHHLAGMTAGIKNLMGILKPLGDPLHGTKSHLHIEWDNNILPKREAKDKFERRLADLLDVKKLNLTIIDGSYSAAISESSSSIVKTNFLLASRDVIAADIACAMILGFNPKDLHYLQYAQQKYGKRKIKFLGDPPKHFNLEKSPIWLSVK